MTYLYVVLALATVAYYTYLTYTSLNVQVFKDRREAYTIIFTYLILGMALGGADLLNSLYVQMASTLASVLLGIGLLAKIKKSARSRASSQEHDDKDHS